MKEQAKIQECEKCGYTFSKYYLTELCDECYNIRATVRLEKGKLTLPPKHMWGTFNTKETIEKSMRENGETHWKERMRPLRPLSDFIKDKEPKD